MLKALEIVYKIKYVLQNSMQYAKVQRLHKCPPPRKKVYNCYADVKVHEENKCPKLHKYLHPCESVRKCVFHVVIDGAAFTRLFELLAKWSVLRVCLPLYGRNSVFLENSKEHYLYSLCYKSVPTVYGNWGT